MPRPIDANALEQTLRYFIDHTILGGIEQHAYKNVLEAVRRMPSIDENYIVRCKECANQQKCGYVLVCMMTGKVVLPSFFCNFGAKMTGATETSHRPEDCMYHANRKRDGQAVCLGTQELDPCEGSGCKRWKAKEGP